MITAHFDIRDVDAGFAAMIKRGANLKPVLRDFRKVLAADLRLHFEEKTGPVAGWAPPSRATIERTLTLRGRSYQKGARRGKATKRGNKQLRNQLGRLRTAWTVTMTRELLEFRSRVPWADVHQQGGRGGKGQAIPARPFAWMSDALFPILADRVVFYLVEGW